MKSSRPSLHESAINRRRFLVPAASAALATVVTTLFLTASLSCSLFSAPPPAAAGFKWVRNEKFSDEFNGTSLDTNKWFDHFPTWKGRPPAKFIPSAVSVTNGCLQLQAGTLPQPDGPFLLAGSAVVSRSEEAFCGYYEARMKGKKQP